MGSVSTEAFGGLARELTRVGTGELPSLAVALVAVCADGAFS